MDIASHQLKPITTGRWRIGQFDWLPSGDRLAAIATATPDVDLWTDRLYAIQLETETSPTSRRARTLGGLSVSPDGKTIAYVARVDRPRRSRSLPATSRRRVAQNLTAGSIDRPVAEPRWIDNQSIAIHVSRGFRSALTIVGRDGKATAVEGLDLNPSAFSRSLSARWRMSARRRRARRSC